MSLCGKKKRMSELLNIQNLSAGYKKGKPVLEEFSLTLSEREKIGIIGKNGSGKSTLAKAIMGITPFTEGNIFWQGKALNKIGIHQRADLGIGFFMQGGRVFGNLTVKENIEFAISKRKIFNFEKALLFLEGYNIDLFKNKQRLALPAANLSGGERHILAFVMVVLAHPEMKLLIADEPSAGVAKGVQKELLTLIKSILENSGIALLLIEHNRDFLNTLTDKTINLTE